MASYCSRTVHHIWMWCNHRLLGKICIAWLVGSGFWRLQRRCCTKSFTVIAGVFHVSCKYYASSSPVIMKLEKVQQKLQMAHKKSCLLSTALRHSFYFEGGISQGFLYQLVEKCTFFSSERLFPGDHWLVCRPVWLRPIWQKPDCMDVIKQRTKRLLILSERKMFSAKLTSEGFYGALALWARCWKQAPPPLQWLQMRPATQTGHRWSVTNHFPPSLYQLPAATHKRLGNTPLFLHDRWWPDGHGQACVTGALLTWKYIVMQ